MTSDIVLQLLSWLAEELTKIKQHQAEGIELAKAQGKHLDPPKLKLQKHLYVPILNGKLDTLK